VTSAPLLGHSNLEADRRIFAPTDGTKLPIDRIFISGEFEVARRQVRGRYSVQCDRIVRVIGYDRVFSDLLGRRPLLGEVAGGLRMLGASLIERIPWAECRHDVLLLGRVCPRAASCARIFTMPALLAPAIQAENDFQIVPTDGTRAANL
jgi:hypothetical protein